MGVRGLQACGTTTAGAVCRADAPFRMGPTSSCSTVSSTGSSSAPSSSSPPGAGSPNTVAPGLAPRNWLRATARMYVSTSARAVCARCRRSARSTSSSPARRRLRRETGFCRPVPRQPSGPPGTSHSTVPACAASSQSITRQGSHARRRPPWSHREEPTSPTAGARSGGRSHSCNNVLVIASCAAVLTGHGAEAGALASASSPASAAVAGAPPLEKRDSGRSAGGGLDAAAEAPSSCGGNSARWRAVAARPRLGSSAPRPVLLPRSAADPGSDGGNAGPEREPWSPRRELPLLTRGPAAAPPVCRTGPFPALRGGDSPGTHPSSHARTASSWPRRARYSLESRGRPAFTGAARSGDALADSAPFASGLPGSSPLGGSLAALRAGEAVARVRASGRGNAPWAASSTRPK